MPQRYERALRVDNSAVRIDGEVSMVPKCLQASFSIVKRNSWIASVNTGVIAEDCRFAIHPTTRREVTTVRASTEKHPNQGY
jgi:hypothetical protein